MHELSLCASIYDIAARAAEGRPVRSIGLDVGQMRQVVPQTLEYCWGLVSEGTSLAGSVLDINHIAVEISCIGCSARTVISGPPVLRCGECDSTAVTLERGEEFMLTTLLLAD
ncbi:hydrogenase maturation nickel metallochaperone HypA [Micrococcales bacterium 31B]|nr:hydrogenase maturation nickel metallochaperone HypA [Micrococcales bacterium 31B]